MTLDFTKMNGAGNDFIMLDNRSAELKLTHEQIARLCDRHRGIGADGVLILEVESDSSAIVPIRMRYYNADGHEAEMCGNGARCFTRYASHLLGKSSGKIKFQTQAGPIEGEILKDQVRILMSDPHSIQLSHSLILPARECEVHTINTGVPHAVIFVTDLNIAPVIEEGSALRNHRRFAPAGTNVNFVQVISPNKIAIRTFERGVEDETLACGTGVVASAIVHHLLSKNLFSQSTAAATACVAPVQAASQQSKLKDEDEVKNKPEKSNASTSTGNLNCREATVPEASCPSSAAATLKTGSKTPSSISVLVRGGDTLQVDFVSIPLLTAGSLPNLSQVTLTGPADFIFEGTISL